MVWATLVGMYGTRLTRDFGESVPEPWTSAIRTLNDQQIQRGLRRLTATGSASTPTLPVFVKACRQLGDDEGEIRPNSTYLPAPDPDALNCHGQKVMLSFLRHQTSGASDASLRKMIAVKNKLIEQYRWITQDEPAAASELRDKLWAAFTAVWEPSTPEELAHNAEVFERTGHFPDRMAAP